TTTTLVDLSAGMEVLEELRNVSSEAIMVTIMTMVFLISLGLLRTLQERRSNIRKHAVSRIVRHDYIETGKGVHVPILELHINSLVSRPVSQSRNSSSLGRSWERKRRWVAKIFEVVFRHHPWVAAISPSSTTLPYTPLQMLLLLLVQVNVMLMVQALFYGKSPDSLTLKMFVVIISSVATIPSSIILPYLFRA
ncbi:unnamed protein product, partial [Discosporangium mesarthrocarpum]